MNRTALDRPRDDGAGMAGDVERRPKKTELWAEETRIPGNCRSCKNAHGDPVCSFVRTAIRMPGTNNHFHQSGKCRL